MYIIYKLTRNCVFSSVLRRVSCRAQHLVATDRQDTFAFWSAHRKARQLNC